LKAQTTHAHIPGSHTLPHAQKANCIWAAALGPPNKDKGAGGVAAERRSGSRIENPKSKNGPQRMLQAAPEISSRLRQLNILGARR